MIASKGSECYVSIYNMLHHYFVHKYKQAVSPKLLMYQFQRILHVRYIGTCTFMIYKMHYA